MSHIEDRELTWDAVSTALKQILHLYTKGAIHTSLPGIVEEYDPETRRARVRPALRLLRTDGTPLDRTPLVNVPIIFPSGGGFVFTFPIAKDDPVLLVFSARGMSAFKQTYDIANPDMARYFSISDAVAFAGFGPLAHTPASTDGVCLQTEDGTTAVVVEDGKVTINVPAGSSVNLGGEGGQELATREFVENYHNTHTHPTPSGGGESGRPTVGAPLTGGMDITSKGKSE